MRKLREAGAVVLGKLSTHEFAIGGPASTCRGRRRAIRGTAIIIPAARRAGSGSALAAGMFPAALGTDTGGTVRNPASCCGIVGLKPTYGLVSRRGVFPLSFTLDHVGPMTRTVDDNALMLDVIAGHDPLDPGSAAGPAGPLRAEARSAACAASASASSRHFHETDLPARPRGHGGAGARRARPRKGWAPRSAMSPCRRSCEFGAVNRVILQSEAWAIHAPWLRERRATTAGWRVAA